MKSKLLPILGIGSLAFLFVYWPVVQISESDFACGYCHNEQKERWVHSTHDKVHCRDCHVEPGVSGALQAQIQGAGNLWVALTKGNEIQPHEQPLPISTENCIRCHAGILYVNEIGYEDLPDNSLKGQSLKVSHRVHVEEYSIACVECHRGIVHRDPEDIGKYETNWPFMHKDCGVCHDGEYWERFDIEVTDVEGDENCIVCHPTYIGPGEDQY